MVETLRQLQIDLTLCIAGIFGCLVTIGRSAASNFRMMIASIAAGIGCANYLTPAIVDSLHLQDPKWGTGLAFILGTIGLKATESLGVRVEKVIKNRQKPSN